MGQQSLIIDLISLAKNLVDIWLGRIRNLGVSGHVGELKIMRYASAQILLQFKMLIKGNWVMKRGKHTVRSKNEPSSNGQGKLRRKSWYPCKYLSLLVLRMST